MTPSQKKKDSWPWKKRRPRPKRTSSQATNSKYPTPYLLREEHLEKELRKQKEDYINNTRLEKIKEQERELLDTRSQPIRQYLMDNVVPILTEGLIDVCKELPENPVDFLAEYLFKRSLEVPYPNPA